MKTSLNRANRRQLARSYPLLVVSFEIRHELRHVDGLREDAVDTAAKVMCDVMRCRVARDGDDGCPRDPDLLLHFADGDCGSRAIHMAHVLVHENQVEGFDVAGACVDRVSAVASFSDLSGDCRGKSGRRDIIL